MKHNYEYAGERIILKSLEREDIEALRTLRNENRQYFLNSDVITAEGQCTWYESYLKKQTDIMFKVVLKEKPEEFIGAIALYDIDEEKGIGEFGRLLIDKEKISERGLGADAVNAICGFAFERLGLNQVSAVVLKNNERALKVYLNVGFRICGETKNSYEVVKAKDC